MPSLPTPTPQPLAYLSTDTNSINADDRDLSKGAGGPAKISPDTKTKIILERLSGDSYQTIQLRHGVSHGAVANACLNLDPDIMSRDDIDRAKKSLLVSKLKISSITDSFLLERLETNPDRITTSELVIAGGVATQRALELEKTISVNTVVDWSQVTGSLSPDSIPPDPDTVHID